MLRRRTLLATTLGAPLLGACGFALRKPPEFAFKTIALAMPANSSLTTELRRQLEGTGRVQVITDPAQVGKADAVLESPGEVRERVVVSVNATGEVRELTLRIRFSFRLRTADASCCPCPRSCARSTRVTPNRPRCRRSRKG